MRTSRQRVGLLAVGATTLGLAASLTIPLELSQAGPSAAARSTASAPSLFGAASSSAARRAADTSVGATERSRYVSFRADLLPAAAKGQKVDLPFFDDADFTATVKHVDKQKLFTSWSGPLDTSYGTFVATKTGDIYSVTATTLQGSYTMTRTGSGDYQVAEVTTPTPTGDDEVVPPSTSGASAATGGAMQRSAATQASSLDKKKGKRAKVGDDGTVEDILVVYTAAAAAAYGGAAGIQAEAAKNIAYTNAAYANSGVGTTARLVAVQPVSGVEQGGDLEADLTALQTPGDGVFDEVFGYVSQFHADDTLLLDRPYNENLDSVCGLGFRNGVEGKFPAAYAFATVFTGACTNAYYSFPHELGHNQSASHDYYASTTPGSGYSSTPPLYPYGYGYVAPNYAFYTVMAYYRKCQEVGHVNLATTCKSILYFSNPAGSYGGQATGDGTANVAQTINNTREPVAAHQQSVLYPTPVKIKGKVKPGKKVRAKFQKWVNTGVTYRYTWYRDGKLIKGAKHKKYKVKARDVGKKLAVVVVGAKPYYADVAAGSKARNVKGHKRGKHGHKHGHKHHGHKHGHKHHGHKHHGHKRATAGVTPSAAVLAARPNLRS